MKIPPHFFKLNENTRTFIRRFSETSLIRFFIFTNIWLSWLYRWHYDKHIMHQAFILSSDLHKWLFLFLSCFWPLHNVPAFKQIILCLYFLLFLTLVCNCNRIFPIVTFHSLWNRQKTKRFLMVSRGIIWKHWFEIILITWWITFVYCWFYICFRPGFWGTFFCFIWERIDLPNSASIFTFSH